MVEKEVCKQQSPLDQQNLSNYFFLKFHLSVSLSFSLLLSVSGPQSFLSGWCSFFFWFCPVFRVWNSILRMPCHRPAPAPPDAASDPGFHSPKARASAGSSPQAPRRHTVRHLWSSHWPLYKGKRVTKIYEIKKKKTAEHSQRNQPVSF